MRSPALLLIVGLSVILSLFAFGQVHPPTPRPVPGGGAFIPGDHYLAYKIKPGINLAPSQTPALVNLQDQFGVGDFKVGEIKRLLNPVEKTRVIEGVVEVSTVEDPDIHYFEYPLKGSIRGFEKREVTIDNQFEHALVRVGKPETVLLPGEKVHPSQAFSNTVDLIGTHFLCHKLEGSSDRQNIIVRLRDQFGQHDTQVLTRSRLCAPAIKSINGEVRSDTDISDRALHLTCYKIKSKSLNRAVKILNQFESRFVRAQKDEEICVPTLKNGGGSPCLVPDVAGTAKLVTDQTLYVNVDDQLHITDGLPGGSSIDVAMFIDSFFDIFTELSVAGEDNTFKAQAALLLSGNGDLNGFGRILAIPELNGQFHADPRTPGLSPQSFDTEVLGLQLQLPPGDPDFDLLRITAGSSFGLPSPGHTTLTRESPTTFSVDSFFDITYRIDFVGKPGGSLGGMSGSTTGTIRMAIPCLRMPGRGGVIALPPLEH